MNHVSSSSEKDKDSKQSPLEGDCNQPPPEEQPTTPSFRSLLPHEPIPPSSLCRGYLQIQGAWEPKCYKNDPHASNDDTATKQEFFWKRETFLHAIERIFGAETKNYPYPAVKIELVHYSPGLANTKVRLTYQNPLHSFHCFQLMFKKITPSSLFSYLETGDDYRFGHRLLQVNPITTAPLLEPAWLRAGPPKFRRLIPRPGDDLNELIEEKKTTRFVYVSCLVPSDNNNTGKTTLDDFWNEPAFVAQALRSVFDPFDSTNQGTEVFIPVTNKVIEHCHIGMRCTEDAARVISELQGKQVTWEFPSSPLETHGSQRVNSGPLFLDFATISKRSQIKADARAQGKDVPRGEPARSECTSTTDHVSVPGLVLVSDFLSIQEERAILAVLQGPHAPWAPSQRTPTEGRKIRRKVQHYGYVFDYKTADVLRDRTSAGADCPKMPTVPDEEISNVEDYIQRGVREGRAWEVLGGVVERTRGWTFQLETTSMSFPELNQMTCNQYAPGEGIGPHVDTPSAFGDGLISISLNSGTVMEFRKTMSEDRLKKLVYLPPRSLLLMTGPARYEWEHMIHNRMTDTIQGQVLTRGTRLSLTLRTALSGAGLPMPRITTTDFPPTWGSNSHSDSFRTPDCEKNHVHAVYDAIAKQWHHTRGRRGVLWPGATQFLQRLPSGSIVADVGCGDGKYFPAIWEAGSFVIGTDISVPLLETTLMDAGESKLPESRKVSVGREYLSSRPAVAAADCMSVPLRNKSCDAAICIAVMHHLSTKNRRLRCIEELVRIVRPGGTINIQAWALDQESNSRRQFASEDVFVPFNAQPKYLSLSKGTESYSVEESQSSAAELYSAAFENTEYNEEKGLVVFNRYCHMYRQGELENLVTEVDGVKLVASGFETGNYFVILEVL